MSTYTPQIGDWVRGFDGYTMQQGRVVATHHCGGTLVDSWGAGRAILTDVQSWQRPDHQR